MKTVFNLLVILAAGAVSGLAIRGFMSKSSTSAIPADEVVYTNDDPSAVNLTPDQIENPEPAKPAPDSGWMTRFELTERSGKTVTSEDLLGKPYLVNFFFTTCPSICVLANQELAKFQEEFTGSDLRILDISVDPETDTPERMREYAARFGADDEQWLFLTSNDLTYIRRIGTEIFQQPVNKQFHREMFVLVDREGMIEGFYSWREPRQMEKLREEIQEMLATE
ncbi:MAG: SCO family protein [Planctomycetota bacterium]